MQPFCPVCKDTCADTEDPTGQADCRHCGGSFAWRLREEYFRLRQAGKHRAARRFRDRHFGPVLFKK